MSTSFNDLPQITPFEELTIQNDFLFQRVMRNKRICKRLIEEILNTKIASISFIHTQKAIKSFYDSKGVFLDVTVEDEQRTRYNLEMQVENRRSKSTGEPLLPKRTRYYQAMLDADILEKGQAYDKLKPTYIIFICPFDLFHEGRYIYTFRKLCVENKNLELNDKATVIFLNAAGKHGDITSNAKSFLHYVKSHKVTDEFTQEISSEISKIKRDEKARREYMQYAIKLHDLQNDAYDKGLERGWQEGLQSGLERGRQETAIETAIKLKKRHKMSDQEIADVTELSVEQVQAIRV